MASVGLTEAFERFLTSLKAAKKSPNTVDAYRRDLDAVAELLIDPLDKPVKRMRLRDGRCPRCGKRLRSRRVHCTGNHGERTHSAWSRFYKFARSEGLTTVAPIEEVEKVKTGTTRPRSIDAPDLAARLLEAATTPPPDDTRTPLAGP